MLFEAKIVGDGLVAGAALTLDVLVFMLLLFAGVAPGFANICSASLAVTFGYFFSAKTIFYYKGEFLFTKFLIYLVYIISLILVSSYIIQFLTDAFALHGFCSKVAVTPFTFYPNFLFFSFLLIGRIQHRWAPRRTLSFTRPG